MALLAALLLLPAMAKAELRAGVEQVDITPATREIMWGYGPRTNTGTLDPLYARVLLLDDGQTTIALVTLDLGRTFGAMQMDQVRTRVREAGIEHVIFTASHTHSGPAVLDRYDVDLGARYSRGGTGVPEWEQKALSGIATAIETAYRRRQSARFGSGWGVAFLGHDRRYVNLDGSVKMLWRNATRIPTYPVDPTVGVLRVDGADGEPLAILVNYACHPVIFGPDNLLYSADFPGALAEAVQASWNGRPKVFFLQGAAGDTNPFLDKTPLQQNAVEEMRRVGQKLGREVARVSHEITTLALPDARIGIAVEPIEFGFRFDPVKAADLQSRMYIASKQAPAPWDGKTSPTFDLPSTTMTLTGAGQEWAFVGMPGEPFVNFQLELRARSPVSRSYFLGYTNGYFAYLPTLREAAAGGYGAASNTAWIEVGAGERLLNRGIINIYRLLGRLPAEPGQ